MTAAPTLELRELRKEFGALQVLRGVTTTGSKGEVRAVIGPNGAGKTTLVNVLTGVFRPSGGTVLLEGTDVTGLASFRISRRGLSRTYQIASLFPDLSVLDHVRVACHAAGKFAAGRTAATTARNWAYDNLALVNLTQLAHRRARELSHGDQRLLEVAIAVAVKPLLLLLDEPTAGMSPAETHRFIDLVNNRLRGRCTLVIVEHDMNVVMNTADIISVLAGGAILAEGAPTDIRRNTSVQEAYLGSAYA